LWVSRRVRRSADFFVAGRDLPGGLVFVTLLAANIGAGSTVGATGLGYVHGLSAWWWSGSAALGCVGLGLLVAPRLHRLAAEHGFLTVGDFLEWRFDRSVRGLVSLILWFGTLAILAGQLIAMAWAFEVMAGLPKAWGCVAAGIVLLAYFAGGGLLAAAWVNLLELLVLLVGFALAVPFAWSAAGGWPGLRGPDPAFARMDGMGAAAILGLLVTFAPSFMISPGLVQKTFGARTPQAARRAGLANAAALAVFAFVPALLGMAVRARLPGLDNPELALPVLTADLLPPWLGALALAALFAAEISTADAVLFMLSTSLAKDLYKAFLHPDADDARLLRVGRLTTVVAGAIGVGLAIALPSVVDALKLFYAVMTVALFVPLVGGLVSARAGAGAARASIAAAIVVTLALRIALSGPETAWLPYAAGIAAAAAVFAIAGRYS
jgi:SSS family solute:Na+ symporter